MKKLSIKFDDLRQIKVDYKTRAIDAISQIENNLDEIIGIKVNNEIKPFEYELVKDSDIDFIKYNSEDGYRIYTRTLKMILYMALTKLYGNVNVEFISTINKDQYFVTKNLTVTEEVVSNIKNKMIEIIKQKLPIVKKSVPVEEAEVLYTESKDIAKLDNLNNKIQSYTTMYFCDNLYNYFYGQLAMDTSYIKSFELVKYKDGMLLVIPSDLSLGYHFHKGITETRLYDSFINFNKLNEILGINNVGNLNSAVLSGKIESTIQSSEAIHQRKIVELVLDIEARKHVKMVLIAGPSSSR